MKKMCVVLVLVFLAFLSPLAWAIEKIAGLELAGNITKATDGGNGKFYVSTDWSMTSNGTFVEVNYDGKNLVQRHFYEDYSYPLISFLAYNAPGLGNFYYLLRGNTEVSSIGVSAVFIEDSDWEMEPRPFTNYLRNYEMIDIGEQRAAVFHQVGEDNYMRIYDLTNPRNPDSGDGGYCYNALLSGRVQKAKMDETRQGYLYLAYEGTDTEGFEFLKYVQRPYCPQRMMNMFLNSPNAPYYRVEIKDFVVEGNQIWLLFYDKNYWSGGILRFEYDFDSDPYYSPERVSYGLYSSDPNCMYFNGRMKSMTKVGDRFFVAKGLDGFCVVENQKIMQDFPGVPADEIVWIGGDREEILVVFENKVSVYALAESSDPPNPPNPPEPPKPPKKKADISAAILLLLDDE